MVSKKEKKGQDNLYGIIASNSDRDRTSNNQKRHPLFCEDKSGDS